MQKMIEITRPNDLKLSLNPAMIIYVRPAQGDEKAGSFVQTVEDGFLALETYEDVLSLIRS